MKLRHILIPLFAALAAIMVGCSDNNVYDDVPTPISKFLAHYYPNSALESFTATGTSYRAVIKNGPTLTFNTSCQWTDINGNGEPLPEVFLFNEVPPALYAYVQETENLNSVYAASRDGDTYTLTFLSTAVTYDAATGQFTGALGEQ